MLGCKGLTRHDLVFILTQFKNYVSLVNNYFSTLPVDVQVLFKEVSCIIGKKSSWNTFAEHITVILKIIKNINFLHLSGF